MTTLWAPNDLFNSYSIYDFDYEEQAGSDAIILSKQLGYASNVELVYKPNKESALNSYAGHYLFKLARWDLQIITGKYHLDHVIGAGFAGDLQGAGVRAELTWFKPTQEQWQGEPLIATSVSSLESDYLFSSKHHWQMRIALLHISHPSKVDNALLYLNQPLTARTLSFTEFTGHVDLGLDITPLSHITLAATYYQDSSYFIGLNNRYSLADNWQVLAVLQRFDGRSDSLFGQSASLFAFAQLKWSF